jgi:hypothetical protein
VAQSLDAVKGVVEHVLLWSQILIQSRRRLCKKSLGFKARRCGEVLFCNHLLNMAADIVICNFVFEIVLRI